MLQKILQIIAKEDTFKLFTGPAGPSILDAFKGIQEPVGLQECQQALNRFFGTVITSSDPSTFYGTEARRMQQVVDGIFAEIQKEYASQAQQAPPRDVNDEVVAIYMESLHYFASDLDVPVLKEHLGYLDR